MNKQRGNSLLEILLVIAVSSVLIVLAVRYFAVVELNMRVARAISQIDIITRASYQWLEYARKPDFSEITNASLTTTGLVTADDITNPWGGMIAVGAGSDSNHVRITLSGLSRYACENLSHHLETIAYSGASAPECKAGAYYGEF